MINSCKTPSISKKSEWSSLGVVPKVINPSIAPAPNTTISIKNSRSSPKNKIPFSVC